MTVHLDNALAKAADAGNIAVVKEMLARGVNPQAHDSLALKLAAQGGHLDLVELLLPVSNPKANCSYALQIAAQNGHLEIVRLLLPVSDPTTDHSLALHTAAMSGHLEVVRLLLPASNPKAMDSCALRSAAEQGHLEIVDLLLPHSDYSKVLKSKGFTDSSACDILLSRLPASFTSKFMVANPTLDLPRTRAMLASAQLRHRSYGLADSQRGRSANHTPVSKQRRRS